MALTKVQKTGITDNAIDADKIEDGTIVAADIAPGTITNAKLAGSIANDKLANSSITVNGSSVSLGGSVSAGKVQWQSVVTADGSTATSAVAGNGYFIDTTSNTHTINLPGSPSAGDTIAIKDYAGTFGTNALTIERNGNNIQGVANDSEISTNRASVVLVYIDATKGWLYTNESNVADLENKFYVTATGGTLTTDGDYKIHVFTGDGCFVVSCAGNPAGSDTVDYLVVAGGGGGGTGRGGGGGGGGYRLGTSVPGAPPLASSALPVSATTYPVTVGGGGTGAGPGSPFPSGTSCIAASPGSNSVFSTITSTGGGSDAAPETAPSPSLPTYRPLFNGGSGGGGMGRGYGSPGGDKGLGNTPPVSPSQGNPGGDGATVNSAPGAMSFQGGGGGGAGATGSDGTPNATPSPASGKGGDGSNAHIPTFGCAPQPFYPVPNGYFAGGGGGSGGSGSAYPGAPNVSDLGNGGLGGGASGETISSGGRNGTTNSGGGASSGGLTGSPFVAASGGTGGKGIVIIRYKFQ